MLICFWHLFAQVLPACRSFMLVRPGRGSWKASDGRSHALVVLAGPCVGQTGKNLVVLSAAARLESLQRLGSAAPARHLRERSELQLHREGHDGPHPEPLAGEKVPAPPASCDMLRLYGVGTLATTAFAPPSLLWVTTRTVQITREGRWAALATKKGYGGLALSGGLGYNEKGHGARH